MSRLTAALTIAALCACLCASAITGYAIGQHSAAQALADVTVMPCSAWANDAHPEIPANTLTDACVDDAGTLHTAPTSMEKTR